MLTVMSIERQSPGGEGGYYCITYFTLHIRPVRYDGPGTLMGASQSSFTRYKNDFELVIRATKELEYLLETHFGAPDDKQSGLHDKITAAKHRGQPLPQQLIKHMRKCETKRFEPGRKHIWLHLAAHSSACPLIRLVLWQW